MGRIALVGVMLAALTAPVALGGHNPRWTAKGAITKLNHRAITVHGKSCRITTDSPKLGLRVYVVGSTVKIECADGVLLTIDLLHPSTNTGSSGSASASASGQSVSSSTVSSSSNGTSSSASALAIAGDFSVTGLGNGSISVKGSSSSYTCTIGSGSPDVSAFHVGSHVSKMTCKNDVLDTIAA